MKKLVILLFIGVLVQSGRGAAAQELLVTPAGPPSGGVPTMELPEVPPGGGELVHPGYQGDAMAPISGQDFQPSLEPIPAGEALHVFDCQPALLESTGTWLRRGFWSAEVDAVMMDRVWRRDNFVLMFQPTETINTVFGSTALANEMVIDGGFSGAEVTPRLSLKRFLFRDYKNRDHRLNFIAFGGGQWTDSGRLDAVDDGTLTVGSYNTLTSALNAARISLDNGNVSFDGATSTQYRSDSRFNSFELNYEVGSRMRKDRMEMEPSGEWVRRANHSPSYTLMAGIRYFDLNEDFDWDAFDIDATEIGTTDNQDGTYRVRTDNDLIGTQIGGSWTFETARWSLGLRGKSGIYLNHTDVLNQFEVTGGVTSGDNEVTVDNLSILLEGGIVGKWHLRPNFSLRTGLDIMYISSVALAAEQLNFTPVSTAVVDTGSATYMGGSLGFEAYW